MADPKDTSSFFRKVVKFVASPTSEWGELSSATSSVSESDFAKSELKAMIERKRHNDFVRKREFDMLRKVRREGLTGEQKSALEASSRIDDIDDRIDGGTKHHEVKAKIDEIEQQMVGEGLPAAPRRNSGFYTAPTQPAKLDTNRGQPTQTMPLSLEAKTEAPIPTSQRSPSSTRPSPTEAPPSTLDLELVPLQNKPWAASPPAPLFQPPPSLAASVEAKFAPPHTDTSTEPLKPSTEASSDTSSPPAAANTNPPDLLATPASSSAKPLPFGMPMKGESLSSYEASLAIEINEITHDQGLDEAVVAFANADFSLCERSLLEMTDQQGARADHAETWLTLFDLYRAIGEQAKFESLALDYARQFGLSSPQWFSMPKMMAEAAAQEDRNKTHPSPPIDPCDLGWVCPVRLNHEEVAKLQSLTLQMPLPWVFDWADLAEIEPRACASLSNLFRTWVDQNLDMRWLGGEQLFKILADITTAGNRDIDPIYWKLRFEALRLANRAHQFDEVAIDYCVTYEVSPPSWEPTQCKVQVTGSAHSTSSHPLSAISEISTSFVESRIIEEAGLIEMASLELSGQLVGDITPTLNHLDTQLQSAPIVSVACGKLIRVDFVAAGDLLNWVMRKRGENRTVIFNDAHRLIALFFGAMGINEHAKVKVRTS